MCFADDIFSLDVTGYRSNQQPSKSVQPNQFLAFTRLAPKLVISSAVNARLKVRVHHKGKIAKYITNTSKLPNVILS